MLINNEKPPDGIILDLRGNPGGRVYEAYLTANLFLNEGLLIVGTTGRSRWSDQRSYSTGEDLTGGLPMVVMVDDESASAAEIVAGALHQQGRAALVGDTTFGKGLVQGYSGFQDGSGIRLTISRYYLEGGLYLNEFDSTLHEIGSGLTPDHYYQFEEEREFIRYLGNSFLLYDFAAIYNDSLIAEAANGTINARWLNRFADFCGKDGFVYNSAITERAKYLMDLAVEQKANKKITAAAHDLLLDAERGDMNQFLEHGEYIKRRLLELAWERKFGAFASWSQINLPRNADIKYAASVMETKEK
jgi:carboxyl-terminal processing protease